MNQSIHINLSVDELQAMIESSVSKALSGLTASSPAALEPELLTIKQASELLHLKTSTLYAYVFHRKIEYIKKSGKLYFRRSVMMDWVNSGNHLIADKITEVAYNSTGR